ncbi:putative sulfate/molybdate transporter [Halorientalis halophila]|uniref:putative sulfate/molybdate transporter n=1 Tax=Halorientalis halophila TaxID=3108499 RepID=UPI00300AF660
MAVSNLERVDERLPFAVGDLTGALGDSVTVLPLVVALGALTPASLAHVLVGFGGFQILWGLRYDLPLSVEPMKALAGLAIAGALSYAELVAAGLLAGGVLLVMGATGALGRLQRVIGRPVVRGVQFAVALLLVEAGLDLALGDPQIAVLGVCVAGGVALAGFPRAAALVVLALGTLWTALLSGVPAPALPALAAFPSGGPTLSGAALEGTLAQLAMTVGNAAVATSLLCDDLFDREVSPDRLARSMGGMSLAAVPLGGLPMCHGSGGLAGKYAFGARTGTANVVLGVLYLAGALVAGLWLAFPLALLGVLLAAVAAQLGRVALDTDHLPLVGAMGLLALVANVGVAFLLGLTYWLVRERRADGNSRTA